MAMGTSINHSNRTSYVRYGNGIFFRCYGNGKRSHMAIVGPSNGISREPQRRPVELFILVEESFLFVVSGQDVLSIVKGWKRLPAYAEWRQWKPSPSISTK